MPADQLSLSFDTFEEDFGQGDVIRDALTIVASKVNDPQDQVLFPHIRRLFCCCTVGMSEAPALYTAAQRDRAKR